jgi:hypothetical protein
MYKNNITAFDLRERMPYHVDIPRMRKGRVGGFFWSVYVGCKVSALVRAKVQVVDWDIGRWPRFPCAYEPC